MGMVTCACGPSIWEFWACMVYTEVPNQRRLYSKTAEKWEALPGF